MPDDGKNFRAGYYERVGFKGVDVKKSLEVLLNESPNDLFKLSQFGLKFDISNVHRVVLWKVLLGISPCQQAAFGFIEQQRYEQTELLRKSLITMRLNDPVSEEPGRSDRQEQRNSFKMFLLEHGKLGYNVRNQCEDDNGQKFLAIANVVYDVVLDFCDRYWLTKSIFSLTQQSADKLILVVRHAESIIRVRMPEVLIKLEKLSYTIPLARWFYTLFAHLHPKIIVKIWDKVFCGSFEILSHLALAVLQTLKPRLLMSKIKSEVDETFNQILYETQELIVLKALEAWENTGRLLMPPELRERANSMPNSAKQVKTTLQPPTTGHSGRRSFPHQHNIGGQQHRQPGLSKTISNLK